MFQFRFYRQSSKHGTLTSKVTRKARAINNRYLDFVQLVTDNQVDNNLKEILVYVYYGSIVNKFCIKLDLS